MFSVSKEKPIKRFEIKKTIGSKCEILFYDNILRNEFKNLYTFDLYRMETTYRPELEDIINNSYNEWLEFAKGLEKNNEEEKEYSELGDLKSENLSLVCDTFLLEHRLMLMETNNGTRQIKMNNFDKSPYKKAKKIIESKALEYNTVLSALDDFVNNYYMEEKEYEELYDLLESKYNSLV